VTPRTANRLETASRRAERMPASATSAGASMVAMMCVNFLGVIAALGCLKPVDTACHTVVLGTVLRGLNAAGIGTCCG
jgi:hypothetical protein